MFRVSPRRQTRRLIAPGDKFELARQCALAQLPPPTLEFQFHPERKWRLDVAWPPEKFAIEIDGGVFLEGGGRHNRGAGYRADVEKFAEAAVLGWRVVRCLPEQVANGQVLAWVERCLRTVASSPIP